MRPLRVILWVGGLVALATGAGRADAAWNNVFQVCCLGCKSAPATSNYLSYSGYMAAYPADYGSCPPPCSQPCPCPQPCPQRVCETRYEQRTYYAPVTHMETRTAYEPVTTYSRSFYWEPVTNYRVSCFFDSCSCSYKQIATPVTSFRLRERCCPVQSWVARCYSVPVTTMRPFTRCEPVTSCYWTNVAAQPACPAPEPPCPTTPAAGAGAGVIDNRQPPAGAGVNDTGAGAGGASESQKRAFDPYNPQGYRQYNPQVAPKAAPATSVRPDTFVQVPPSARLGNIVPVAPANVEGTIVRADRRPDAGAHLTFKRADRPGETHTVTADGSGRFKATLASGDWTVYTQRTDGQLVANTRIDVRENKTSQVNLTSR